MREHLRRGVTNEFAREIYFPDKVCAAAEVNENQGFAFVHGEYEAVSLYAAFAPKSLVNCLAQNYAYIFHGVVLVYLKVSLAVNGQTDSAMVGELLQHVVKEVKAGTYS